MICFFATTIYHNLASLSLITYCFVYKNTISLKKWVEEYSMISNSYKWQKNHRLVRIIHYSPRAVLNNF